MSVAAHKGNVIIMQYLIDFGSNVNALNNSGSTALIQVKYFVETYELSLELFCRLLTSVISMR